MLSRLQELDDEDEEVDLALCLLAANIMTSASGSRMSKTAMYTGADPSEDSDGEEIGEFEDNQDVTGVTVADGVTGIKNSAFFGCEGITNLSFLKDSGVTTVGADAFSRTCIITLQGMEGVTKIGNGAFFKCKDLRTIEGLGCEEMGHSCFMYCTLLQSMKWWPASMTVIPANCFCECTGMSTVDCDFSHVTSIGANAFCSCTSLLPPSLSAMNADPAAVLAYLKKKSFNERAPLRYAIYASALRARGEEELERTDESPTPLAFAIAKLPADMARVIVEFAHGVFRR
jgi:hypothetical protein